MVSPLVEIANANLYLNSGRNRLHILKDVNLDIASSEVVAIVGPSGSGKTSLLMMVGGLEPVTSGKITIDGHDLSTFDENGLALFRRKHIGIVFQNFHLIPSLNAVDNVILALEIAETGQSYGEMRAAAGAALTDVGLGERLEHMPSALSGGEQQRVALARAMVGNPQLLLADEPTGNLDQDTGEKVITLMFDLAHKRNTAVLLITHDPNLAARADRCFVMNRGQLEIMTDRRLS